MSELMEYKCPNCAGSIKFDSTAQKLKCSYCGTEFDPEALKSYDETLKKEASNEMNWELNPGTNWEENEKNNIVTYVCKSCGGEIIGDSTTAATHCPFCDNPVIIAEKFAGNLKPDYLIPFKLDKNDAKKNLLNHFKSKKLLPKIFKDENHIDKIKGIYVPFWLFDAKADADINYRATRVNFWSDSNYNYTQTMHYLLTRAGDVAFEKIPVDGSSKIDDKLMESIEPFDPKDVVDFQTAYLSGYLADKYDVEAKNSIEKANERIKKSVEEAFYPKGEGYATVIPKKADIKLKNGDVKYALYPVWLLNTSWKEKKYTFAMNGQTGKFVGNLPCDKVLYCKWLAGLTIAASALTYGIVWLAHLFL